MQGHEILNGVIDAGETEFSVTGFPPGVYAYTLLSSGKVIGAGKWVRGE